MSGPDISLLLVAAGRHFRSICTGEQDPLTSAAVGMTVIVQISQYDTAPFEAYPSSVDVIANSITEAFPKIVEAASRWIAPEQATIALGAAFGLLASTHEDGLREARKLKAAEFAYKLSAAVCERESALIGDPLIRAITVARAWNEFDPKEHRPQ